MSRLVAPRDFWKYDVLIAAVTFMYYLIAQFKINVSYSTGYAGIWLFFTFEHAVLLVTQAILILSDRMQKKTFIVSVRSCAIVVALGCALINTCLGLYSIWLIIETGIVISSHLVVFISSLKMQNDPYLIYATRFERRMLAVQDGNGVLEL